MFGMPKIDPKKMQAMMKQMGIAQEEIDAKKVTIEKCDGNKIIIENLSVQKIKISGQESFQISGDIREESAEAFSEEDVKLVAEKTGKPKEKAREALEKAKGDIAEAILQLSE